MLTYLYIVKCPECEDEFFDFFDEAKDYATGCLTKKPIITQVEVDRNDFGECTDSTDLGTVWSWEDMMTDAEPTVSVFTKDDLKCMNRTGKPCCDAEFDNLDNSIDVELDSDDKITEETHAMYAKPEGDRVKAYNNALKYAKKDNKPYIYGYMNHTGKFFALEQPIKTTEATYEVEKAFKNKYKNCKLIYTVYPNGDFIEESLKDDNFKKPIPEGMTIKQLVEAMEENEDTVECAGCEELFPKDECFHKEGIGYLCGDCEDRIVKCTWCDDLFDKGECRYEVDLGWLCDRCEAAIKSRGETLTFREGSYWDFLDEKLDLGDIDFSNCVSASDHEIWGVEHEKDNIYKAILLKRYENVSFNDVDKCDKIHEEMYDIDGLFLFTFGKDGKPDLTSWNVSLLRKLGAIYIGFDDTRYEAAIQTVFEKVHRATSKLEDLEPKIVNNLGNLYDGGYPTEKPDLPEDDEISEVSDSHLVLCPECGKDTFDIETGVCIECGFN